MIRAERLEQAATKMADAFKALEDTRVLHGEGFTLEAEDAIDAAKALRRVLSTPQNDGASVKILEDALEEIAYPDCGCSGGVGHGCGRNHPMVEAMVEVAHTDLQDYGAEEIKRCPHGWPNGMVTGFPVKQRCPECVKLDGGMK